MNEERIYTIILAPHVSEKSTLAGELSNQYTFKVVNDDNKLQLPQSQARTNQHS